MSNKAYECDRCGALERGSPERRVWLWKGGHGRPPYPHALDEDLYLCEHCDKLLRKFMACELRDVWRAEA